MELTRPLPGMDHGTRDRKWHHTPPPLLTEWQTLVKTLPSLAVGKNKIFNSQAKWERTSGTDPRFPRGGGVNPNCLIIFLESPQSKLGPLGRGSDKPLQMILDKVLLFQSMRRSIYPELTLQRRLLPPANEVCEGYVFTPVCQSFCSQGECVWQGGACVAGGGMHI